jgi:hypothetical protein
MIAVALMEQMIQEVERKLVEACEEIIVLKRQLEEQHTVAVFWRQAAEHAIVGWDALEDEHELLKDTLRALAAKEPEPPEVPRETVDGLIDLGDGVTLRIVETETEIK